MRISLSTMTYSDVCIAVIYVHRFWQLSAILFSLSAFAVARIEIYLIHSCSIKPSVQISMTTSVHKILGTSFNYNVFYTKRINS